MEQNCSKYSGKFFTLFMTISKHLLYRMHTKHYLNKGLTTVANCTWLCMVFEVYAYSSLASYIIHILYTWNFSWHVYFTVEHKTWIFAVEISRMKVIQKCSRFSRLATLKAMYEKCMLLT